MTIHKAFWILLATCLLGGTLGLILGALIGWLNPEYYLAVFDAARKPGFNPIRVGIGLGTTQGVSGGIVVGLVLIAVFTWREKSTRSIGGSELPGTHPPRNKSMSRWILMGCFAVLVCLAIFGIGYIAGAVFTNYSMYYARYLEEKKIVEPLLAADPAFASVTIERSSVGAVTLYGHVATDEDRGRLRRLLVEAIGHQRAEKAIGGIDVK